MKRAIIAGCLLLQGCVSRKDFVKFQMEELARDEKIISLVDKMAENQLVMAKKLTQDEADFLRAGRRAAKKTDDDFESELDSAQRELDAFMEIGRKGGRKGGGK